MFVATPAGRCCHVWLYLPVSGGTCNSPCGPNVDVTCVLWEGAPSWHTGKERICVLSDVMFFQNLVFTHHSAISHPGGWSDCHLLNLDVAFSGLLVWWERSWNLAELELVEKLHHVQMLLICLGGMCISCSLSRNWQLFDRMLFTGCIRIGEGQHCRGDHHLGVEPPVSTFFIFHVLFFSAL